ncbi:hypothetical protein [uncultured Cellulomonas sp.]|uniref:hypothetical protein n=1 Tax=uncultured Cellulomonas sp. TaxID=189682 RepID=UPI0028E74A39|nr:hypothetical protein [uncultured Cellulomonas sp.]
MLSRVAAAVVLALALLFSVAGPAEAAAVPCVKVNPKTGECIISATDPGGPPADDPGPGTPGGGSTGPRVCEDYNGPVECETEIGSWNNTRGCYMELADPQPPLGDAAWEGNTDGVIYRCMIPIPYSPSWWTTYVWLATAEPGPDPREVAEDALALMQLRAGQIATNPPSPDGLSVVGLQTWLWIADPDEHTVGPITRSATAGAVTVTATARLDKVVWDMGDGRSTTCTGPGTPWSPTAGTHDSPTCGHTYRASSARQPDQRYTMTATSYWTIDWAGGGETGTIQMDFASDAQLRVAEVQALVTTGD